VRRGRRARGGRGPDDDRLRVGHVGTVEYSQINSVTWCYYT
jgi:hypothetical protein